MTCAMSHNCRMTSNLPYFESASGLGQNEVFSRFILDNPSNLDDLGVPLF